MARKPGRGRGPARGRGTNPVGKVIGKSSEEIPNIKGLMIEYILQT
jgi:hypothetical protein